MVIPTGHGRTTAAVSHAAADVLRGIGEASSLAAADLDALVAADLLEADGSRTPCGRRLKDDLRASCVVLLLAVDEEGERRARLHVGHSRMLYVGEPLGQGGAEIEVLPSDAVPVVLARWGRMQPSYDAGEVSLGPVDRWAFRRRVVDPSEPVPLSADSATRQAWSAPWRTWSVQCDERDVQLTYVHVSGSGTYLVGGDLEEVTLRPRHSSLLWGDLQGVLGPLLRHHVQGD